MLGGTRTRVADGQRQRLPPEQAAEVHHWGCAGVARERGAHVGGRGDDAIGDDHGALRERRRALEAVLREHDGRAQVGVEARERCEHVVGALRVELRGRLVEHQRRR